MQIVLTIYFYKYLKQSEASQRKFIANKFKSLNEKTDDYDSSLNSRINSFTNSVNSELSKLKNNNSVFIASQQNEFKEFTKVLKTDYKSYVSQIKETNLLLQKIINQLNISITNYENIKKTLLDNYEELELLSDQTIDLISGNEKIISNFRQQTDSLFELLRNTTEDKFTELTAQGEKNLSESLRQNKDQIKAVGEQSIIEIGELFNTEYFKNFKKDVNELNTVKQQFDAVTNNILIEIKEVNEDIKREFKEINTKTNKKGILNFLNKS